MSGSRQYGDAQERETLGVLPVGAGSRIRALATIGTIALVLSWPALLNGGPFFMSDTVSYIRGAASAFYKIFGVNTGWTGEYLRLFHAAGGPARASPDSVATPVTLSGRSVYYGTFLFLTYLAGSFWFAVAIQSALTATALFLTTRMLAGPTNQAPEWKPLLVGIAAGLITPLGYFTSYLMPDLFGGLAVLATANLLFLRAHQPRRHTAFWLALLAYSLTVHNANPPIIAVMTVAAFLYSRWQKVALGWLPFTGVACCLCIAILAQLAFAQAVRTFTGQPPVAPPFLAMRLIADGPGYRFLERHCATEHFIYCRTLHAGRLPSDVLLWDENPQHSLFRGLSPDEQRVSAAEQSRFLLEVAKEEPLAVASTAVQNSLRQLFDFRLVEFNYGDSARTRFKETIPLPTLQSMAQTRAYRNAMPIGPSEVVAACAALLSLLFVLRIIMSRAGAATGRNDALVRGYCEAILVGIAANAVICGVVSGPNGRYEMRVIWILPVVAGSILVSRVRRKHERELDPGFPHGVSPTDEQLPGSTGAAL